MKKKRRKTKMLDESHERGSGEHSYALHALRAWKMKAGKEDSHMA
jgi:hypothetical protein